MGFRIDGCGTYDTAKKLKYVGDYFCSKCKTVHPFYICELVKKVSILYIPVGKISSEYAVLCSKCESGYKLNESQKNRAMSGDIGFLSGNLNSGAQKEPEPAPQRESGYIPAKAAQSAVPKQSGCCPRCGTPIDENAFFCGKCGRKYSADEKAAPSVEKPRICDKCGCTVPGDMLFCTKCGNKINDKYQEG